MRVGWHFRHLPNTRCVCICAGKGGAARGRMHECVCACVCVCVCVCICGEVPEGGARECVVGRRLPRADLENGRSSTL